MRTISGMVMAETRISLPRGKFNASSSKSNPLRTDKQAKMRSGSGQSCSMRATTRAEFGGKHVRQTPNNKSDQPISSLFRDHMEIPSPCPI
jgi:hypothetical protein